MEKNMQCREIVIAGAGLMGSTMSQLFAHSGYHVTLYDISEKALEKGRNMIALNQSEQVKWGALTKETSEKIQSLLAFTTEKDCFKSCDLVVESIVENLEIKKHFYQEISALTKQTCILATNTSGLSIEAISKAVCHPERFAGMHWFNPAHLIPLVEIISAPLTCSDTADFLYELAEKIGKKPIRVKKDALGFIANRLQLAVLREAIYMAEEGIGSIEDIDRCMKYGLGFRYACYGPFEVCDFGGLDTFYHISEYLFSDLCDAKAPQKLLASHFEKGEFGVKSKKGFYDYSGKKDEEAIRARDEMYLKMSNLLNKTS